MILRFEVSKAEYRQVNGLYSIQMRPIRKWEINRFIQDEEKLSGINTELDELSGKVW